MQIRNRKAHSGHITDKAELVLWVRGTHDLMIAATARCYDCSVLTTNVAEFERVPDLDVIQLPS